MNTLILFIIAMGLSMDCFSVSISNSSVSGEVKPGIPLKTALLFSLSHIMLVWLGYWVGGLITGLLQGYQLWVAFFILTSIGAKMILEAYRKRPEAKVFDINNITVVLGLSLATGMDALLAGVVVGILAGPVWLATGLIALTVFIFTLSGLAGGASLGISFARRTAIFGGAFMLVAAIWFLMMAIRPVMGA